MQSIAGDLVRSSYGVLLAGASGASRRRSFIGPAVALAAPHPRAHGRPFRRPLETDEGWRKFNRHHWLRDYRGFLEFFFGKCFTEPH